MYLMWYKEKECDGMEMF